MRVLMISKSLPASFKGGIQTHVWELSGQLVAAGIQVSILTGGGFRQRAGRSRVAGREIIQLPFLPWRKFPGFGGSLEEFAFNLAAARWVLKRHRGYDIIHLQGRSGYLIPFLGLKLPIVNTVHRLWSVEGKWASPDFRNRLEANMFKRLTCFIEQRAISRSTAVIAVSQSTVEEIRAAVAIESGKISLIYNGAAVQKPVSAARPVKNQLLFVGRLCAIKGVFPLVEAMAELDGSIKLIMVGNGPAGAALNRLIEQKGLQNQIVLLGSQEQAVIRRLMRESYALILPSFHESQGIVLLENNLEGRPVLASDEAGIREVVFHQHNGLLFPSNSVQGIVDAIQELFRDPGQAAVMGQRGQAMVKTHFSWEKIARQTIQLYQQLCIGALFIKS